jgi:hypothetical protein
MNKWFVSVIFITALLVLGYFISTLEQTTTEPATSTINDPRAVVLVHAYQDGTHRYTGELRFPHSCFALETNTLRDLKDPSAVIITVKSTDRIIEQRLCAQVSTRYPFGTLVDGPEKLNTTLLVDDKKVPVRIVETAWQNPNGTIMNTSNFTPQ